MSGDDGQAPGRRRGGPRPPRPGADGPTVVRGASLGGPGAPRPATSEVRCDCGSLLARLVGPSIELKCRRCKRSWSIPVSAG